MSAVRKLLRANFARLWRDKIFWLTFAAMAAAGQLTPQSYVWKPGMAAWAHAADVPELAAIFAPAPPPPPVG